MSGARPAIASGDIWITPILAAGRWPHDCIRTGRPAEVPPARFRSAHERDHQLGAGRAIALATTRLGDDAVLVRPSGAHRAQRRGCRASCARPATLPGPVGCVDRCERET